MKALELSKYDRLILSTQDIANIFSITKESAKVTASRYAKKGLLIRLKKDFYIPESKFDKIKETELFGLANILQTPSYISLTTALSFYNISTQQQRNFIESIALKRTRHVSVKEIDFEYILLKKDLYNGFILKDNFFIAVPEKALADAIYLTALKKYNCDFDAINFKKLDIKKVESFVRKANSKTEKFWLELCKTYKV